MAEQSSTSAPPSSHKDIRIEIEGQDQEKRVVDAAPRQNEPVDLVPGDDEAVDRVRRENENEAVNPIHRENGDVDWIHHFVHRRIFDNSDCLQLHKFAREGDVQGAKSFIQNKEIHELDENGKHRLMLCYPITVADETVLHVAAGAKQNDFLREMLQYITPDDRQLGDRRGNNTLCFAAMAGAKEIAEMMLQNNQELLNIRGGNNKTPLHLAVLFGQRDTALFLFKKYEGSPVEDIKDLFFESMKSHFYDLALKLLKLDNRSNTLSVIHYEEHGTALHMLARNPSAFTSTGNDLISYGLDLSSQALHLVKSLWDDIKDLEGEETFLGQNKDLLFEAAKLGNSKFLAELIDFYPNLVRLLNEDGQTIFHSALLYRHVSLFNLMNDIGFNKQYVASLKDYKGNNLLHLAAMYLDDPRPPVSMVPGAALRMQQELKTFKEVALLVTPSLRESKNKDGFTPRELFTKQHKKLLEQGEAWMKKTSESCMLVATIITTVVFTGAYNVPGNYSDEGKPNFRQDFLFCGFAIADAVTLSSASLSILIFLSILTSRYEEEDFLKWLPLMLMLGIITLFVSISTMMLSFSLSFFLDYRHAKASYQTIPILVCTFVFAPALSFLLLQCGLLKDFCRSSFWPRFSLKPVEY